jgi:hypothetical protein
VPLVASISFLTLLNFFRIMKKLFTLLAFSFLCQTAFAATGYNETYLQAVVNGTGSYYKGGFGSNPTFSGNLGTIGSGGTLALNTKGANTYNNGGDAIPSVVFYYRVYSSSITPTATSPAYSSVNLTQSSNNWNSNASINLLANSNMQIGTYNVDVYWVINGTFNAGANSFTVGDGSDASPYRATFTTTVALGAEMTSFTAKKAANTSVISWLTASEKDNATFQIERSANATDFSPIGEVKGAGNSNATKNYTFTDATPLSGVNYYRLKAVDYNGAATLSKIVSVNFAGKNGDKTAVYPNPASDVLRVDYTSDAATTTAIQVTDLTGRVIISQNVSVTKGANLLPLNIASLPSGAYLVKINNDITRFVKM